MTRIPYIPRTPRKGSESIPRRYLDSMRQGVLALANQPTVEGSQLEDAHLLDGTPQPQLSVEQSWTAVDWTVVTDQRDLLDSGGNPIGTVNVDRFSTITFLTPSGDKITQQYPDPATSPP